MAKEQTPPTTIAEMWASYRDQNDMTNRKIWSLSQVVDARRAFYAGARAFKVGRMSVNPYDPIQQSRFHRAIDAELERFISDIGTDAEVAAL